MIEIKQGSLVNTPFLGGGKVHLGLAQEEGVLATWQPLAGLQSTSTKERIRMRQTKPMQFIKRHWQDDSNGCHLLTASR